MKRRIAVLVAAILCMAGSAEAGIYRTATSSQGGEDSIAITFVVKDSIANPITGVTGDSIFIAIFHPGGALAVRDSGRLINSTTATGKLSSAAWRAGTGAFTVYCYATQVSVAAGTTRPGVYPYVLTIRDSSCCVAGGGVMYTFKEGEAQVYTSTTHTFAADLDSATYLATVKAAAIDSASLGLATTAATGASAIRWAIWNILYNAAFTAGSMGDSLNNWNPTWVNNAATRTLLALPAFGMGTPGGLAPYSTVKQDSTQDSLTKAYVLNMYNTVKRDSTQDSTTGAVAAAIKVKTDQLTFTKANRVDATLAGDTLNRIAADTKAMRDSGQYYAQTGSSGTGPQTLTITVIDTSGTDAVVPGVNLSVQNLAQSAVLWSTGSNGTNSLGVASGNNQVSTAICIVGYLPGYVFPNFKDTTGAGTTFADTVRGYNIDIAAPAAANVKRIYGYEYNGVDTLQGLQVVATLVNPPLTGDSVVVDTSMGVQYSAGMRIAPGSGWTTTGGYWYLDLPLNSNISPFGSRWKITAKNADGSIRWEATINVTDKTTDCIGHIANGKRCP